MLTVYTTVYIFVSFFTSSRIFGYTGQLTQYLQYGNSCQANSYFAIYLRACSETT